MFVSELYLVDMRFDKTEAARRQRLLRIPSRTSGGKLGGARDASGQYVAHMLLAEAYSPLVAPKPFRVMDTENQLRVLCYQERYPSESLAGVLERKFVRVPMTTLTAGRALRMNLLAIPTERMAGGGERDVFLRAPELGRERAYLDWLTAHLASGCELVRPQVNGVQLVTHARKTHVDDGSHREWRRFILPQVEFSATIVITNADAFGNLIRRGVGRHRAFGYGMLMLGRA
jgi:CRISPR system Cascade subunit CasE